MSVASALFAALWPIAFMWALSTLFGLGIVVTLKTWVAAFVVLLTLNGSRMTRSAK